MKVNIDALQKLADTKNWNYPYMAKRLGINYSYLFRIMRGEKTGGNKLFSGIYRLCQEEDLNIDDYINWDEK